MRRVLGALIRGIATLVLLSGAWGAWSIVPGVWIWIWPGDGAVEDGLSEAQYAPALVLGPGLGFWWFCALFMVDQCDRSRHKALGMSVDVYGVAR